MPRSYAANVDDTVVSIANEAQSASFQFFVQFVQDDAVREKLSEDADDLAAFDERSPEPLISYEEMLKRLRAADGHIWRLFRKSVASDLARIPEQVGGS